MLEIRPRGGHGFTSPPGTQTLYLPIRRLVAATPSADAIEFTGEFSRTGYPSQVTLGPVDSDDARKLCEVLARHCGLPRWPWEATPDKLDRNFHDVLVSVVDEVQPAHCESSNFAGLRLRSDDPRVRTPGERLRATGFYSRGFEGEGMRPVGYSGPTVDAVSIEGPHHTSIALDHTGGRVDAWTGEGHGRWLAVHSPTQRLVGLIRGNAVQGRHGLALDAHLRALRGLLAAASKALALKTVEQVDPRAAEAVRRGALPQAAGELLVALDRRLGMMFDADRCNALGIAADGVIACVEGRRVTVLRRGIASVHRVRPEGTVTLEVAEQSRARAMERRGIEPESWHEGIATSRFGAPTPEEPGPRSLELAPGERLVFLTGDVLHEREEHELSAALAESTCQRMVARIEAAGRPLGSRWGCQWLEPGA